MICPMSVLLPAPLGPMSPMRSSGAICISGKSSSRSVPSERVPAGRSSRMLRGAISPRSSMPRLSFFGRRTPPNESWACCNRPCICRSRRPATPSLPLTRARSIFSRPSESPLASLRLERLRSCWAASCRRSAGFPFESLYFAFGLVVGTAHPRGVRQRQLDRLAVAARADTRSVRIQGTGIAGRACRAVRGRD